MVDATRRNLDITEESPQAEHKKPQPETQPESQETDDLLRDFSLETLIDTSKSAFYEVKSEDQELGVSSAGAMFSMLGSIFGVDTKGAPHIPEIFRELNEGEKIFNLLKRPSIDLRQIRQRQTFVETLVSIFGSKPLAFRRTF